MTCERHDAYPSLKEQYTGAQGQLQSFLYSKQKDFKCTCPNPMRWCTRCRGSGICIVCNGSGGRTKCPDCGHQWGGCTGCGGTGGCFGCKGTGEIPKGTIV